MELTNSSIQNWMSIEQKKSFVVEANLFVVLALVCILGAIVIAAVIFALQVVVEGARQQREARAALARRLRHKADHREVRPGHVPPGHFHTFLSHVWGTGQDQMRIVKQRLREMIPEMNVFLDVDDLVQIGNLEGYIECSSTVLIYCSAGYFESKNCLRELLAATKRGKPLIALIDSDQSHGGLSVEEVRRKLDQVHLRYAGWGFEEAAPHGQLLHGYLFAQEPIEWTRIGHFQDVTMRLIAERVLLAADMPAIVGNTYVDRELVCVELSPLPPPDKGCTYHVYCSPHNPGAAALISEVADTLGFCVDEGRLTLLAFPLTP